MHFTKSQNTLWVHAYIVVFLYPPSLCQKLDKHTRFIMHHSVSLRTQCFFSHSQSPDTTHSSVCRQCSSVSSLSWANRYFYLCPVSSAGPSWEDEAGYVGAATDVRCRPPFSRAVDTRLLRLSRPPLLKWISHGALCSSTTKICLKVDQSCCQRRKRNRNREASEEGGQRRVFALFKMLIHAHYQKALVKRVSALFNIFCNLCTHRYACLGCRQAYFLTVGLWICTSCPIRNFLFKLSADCWISCCDQVIYLFL